MKKTLLSTGLLIALCFSSKAQIQGYSVGQTITDFTVTDINGNQHNLYSYTAAGKWVLLDFFFDTCPPCQSTTPIFNELHEKYGCNAGDIICISMNNGTDNDSEVAAFESSFGGAYSHAPAVSNDGGAGTVDTDFNPAAYPTYCLIGADNTLKNADIWPINSTADFENAFAAANFSPAVMSCSVSTDDIELISDLSIYPNPAATSATLAFNAIASGDIQLMVYSLVGSLVSTTTLDASVGSNTTSIDVSGLENGQYIIQIKSEDNTIQNMTLNVIR